MPLYESVFVFKPQLSDAEISECVDKTKKIIAGKGGEVLHEDRWGRRKLSYQIRHCREGYYVYFKFQAPAGAIAQMESQWKIQEPIIRSLTVRQDERPDKHKKKAKKA